MNYKNESILIDVDDVIVQNAFIDAINVFKGTNHKEEDFTTYFIDDIVFSDNEKKQFREFLLTYNIYENCKLIVGVEEVLPCLCNILDVYICSSCIVKGLEKYSGIFFKRKFDFLLEKFPYIDPDKIIFTSSKNNFRGFDYQIDDRVENLKGDIRCKMLFSSYHNRDIDYGVLKKMEILRVNSWSEILNNIKNMH